MGDVTEPRSWVSTFIVFASVAALMFLVMIHLIMDVSVYVSIPSAFFFGMFFGFFMAYFIRGETIRITFKGTKKKYLDRINTKISQIGYRIESHSGNFFMYKPTFQAGILAGRISLTIQGKQATIVGPLMYVKKLERVE